MAIVQLIRDCIHGTSPFGCEPYDVLKYMISLNTMLFFNTPYMKYNALVETISMYEVDRLKATKIIKLLVVSGACPSMKVGDRGVRIPYETTTPLHIAIRCVTPTLFAFMLSKAHSVPPTGSGDTLLHTAVKYDRVDLFAIIEAKFPRICNYRNESGYTAIFKAMKKGPTNARVVLALFKVFTRFCDVTVHGMKVADGALLYGFDVAFLKELDAVTQKNKFVGAIAKNAAKFLKVALTSNRGASVVTHLAAKGKLCVPSFVDMLQMIVARQDPDVDAMTTLLALKKYTPDWEDIVAKEFALGYGNLSMLRYYSWTPEDIKAQYYPYYDTEHVVFFLTRGIITVDHELVKQHWCPGIIVDVGMNYLRSMLLTIIFRPPVPKKKKKRRVTRVYLGDSLTLVKVFLGLCQNKHARGLHSVYTQMIPTNVVRY